MYMARKKELNLDDADDDEIEFDEEIDNAINNVQEHTRSAIEEQTGVSLSPPDPSDDPDVAVKKTREKFPSNIYSEKVLELAATHSDEMITALARASAADAFKVIRMAMKSPRVKLEKRAEIAERILERGYGRPGQAKEVQTKEVLILPDASDLPDVS
jgi:hypothetical protein